MRIYKNFKDANNELRRDLAELGTMVHPQTMQDKRIADDPDYLTREFQNMIYTVTSPNLADIDDVHHIWAEAEFDERLRFVPPHEAQAWKLRPEIWTEFAERGLGYTYGERFEYSLDLIIDQLQKNPDSRQLFLSVWNPVVDPVRMGKIRVPCSLGYWFANRSGRLQITYLQRSADSVTHLANDQYLAHRLQIHIANEADLRVGMFTHWIGSLHAYRKDLEEIF